MTFRKKPGVAFWATVVMVVPSLYVLSSGPAMWIIFHTRSERLNEWYGRVYAPLRWLYLYGPWSVRDLLDSWQRLWWG